MSTEDVFRRLLDLGVELRNNGDGMLMVEAPTEVLTDELRQMIRAHKPELLEMVPPDASPPDAAAPRLPVCSEARPHRSSHHRPALARVKARPASRAPSAPEAGTTSRQMVGFAACVWPGKQRLGRRHPYQDSLSC